VVPLIKDNQRIFNQLHVVIDGIVIILAYLLAWWIQFRIITAKALGLPFQTYFAALFFIVPGYLLLYYKFHLYSSKRASGRKQEFLNITKANGTGIILFMVALYMLKIIHFSRPMLLIFVMFNIMGTTIFRHGIRYALRYFRRKGFNLKYVLLVGYSRSAEAYINRIRLNPQWGYVVRGILDDKVESGTLYKGVKVLGRIDNLEIILPENKLDEIAITLSLQEYGKLESIVNLCEKSGVHTKFIPDYNRVIPSKPYTEDLQGLPIINIRHVPLTNTWAMLAKRIVDIFGAMVAMVLFSPIMLLSILFIRITSKGPVIFSQERVGLHNRPFKMYKFRTMEVQKQTAEEKAWTVKNDPRVTRIGRILRKTSMDELPQLFNILRGDMSLVGPRPERPLFVEKFKEEIPRYMIKHQVRPGLTGWAQVNGFRGDTSIRRRIDYDLYYIENWTMGLDIKILFLTFFRGFVNENAY
jgi:Undecaprenyl-phosphate glucose phosphotransferase